MNSSKVAGIVQLRSGIYLCAWPMSCLLARLPAAITGIWMCPATPPHQQQPKHWKSLDSKLLNTWNRLNS